MKKIFLLLAIGWLLSCNNTGTTNSATDQDNTNNKDTSNIKYDTANILNADSANFNH